MVVGRYFSVHMSHSPALHRMMCYLQWLAELPAAAASDTLVVISSDEGVLKFASRLADMVSVHVMPCASV